MKKAILIILLAALLSGCAGSAKEETESVTTAVSLKETTTAATTLAAENSKETTAASAVTTLETTSRPKVTTTTARTSAAKISSKVTAEKTTTQKTVSQTTSRQSVQQTEAQTYIITYDEPAPETKQTRPEVKVTETTTTTVQTSPPVVTTTTKAETTTTTAAAPSGVKWSDSMKVWRKLCEGKKLTGSEQDIIRSEILDYAVSSFNGKKDIHVSFGIDSYDISYEKPLNLKANKKMTSMSNAHMDAYADPNCKGLIDYAKSEKEIYDIVSDTRQCCLHVIDYGLFNRWELFTINNELKYASDIDFGIGFDEDMTIWFLTQD